MQVQRMDVYCRLFFTKFFKKEYQNAMRTLTYTLFLFFSFLLALVTPENASAHAPGQSYLFLEIYENSVRGILDITTDQFNQALDLDLKKGRDVKELQPYWPKLKSYVLQNLAFSSSKGQHTIKIEEERTSILYDNTLGDFVQIYFRLDNIQEIPDALDIRFEVLFDQEPQHQNLVVVAYNWKAGVFDNESMVSLVYTPDDTQQALSLTDASILKGFMTMVELGMHHIWIGIDHILFLLALLLPAVVRRRNEDLLSSDVLGISSATSPGLSSSMASYTAVERFKPALIYVVKIITLFTVAHSITLSLAALNIVNLPSALVESIIALSIALAAYHNIRPLFNDNVWIIAFGFGLFHGFGFASVLGEIGLTGEFMVLSLLGFNLGVELGQLAIICVLLPILYYLRKSRHYPKIMIYGSILLIAIAFYWAIERMFDLDLPLDDFIIRAYNKFLRVVGLI